MGEAPSEVPPRSHHNNDKDGHVQVERSQNTALQIIVIEYLFEENELTTSKYCF